MNRTIKFRAWNPEHNCMEYQGGPDVETLQSFMFHHGNLQLMQYTDLTDKNGKEIYEGDILIDSTAYCDCCTCCDNCSKNCTCMCTCQHFYEMRYGYTCHGVYGFQCIDQFDSDYSYDISKLKIVGNIFENPELMEHSEPDQSPTV